LQKSTEGAWPLTGLGTKSSRTTRMGLAPPRESVGEVKERRKPGRRWQSRDTGGGFPPIGRVARATRLGSSCRGKALWAVDAVLFDARPAEAILVLRDDSGLGPDAARGATGSVRGRTPALNARPTTPSQGGHRHAVTHSRARQDEGNRARIDRSWRRAVKRGFSRGRIAARWSGAARENPISVGEAPCGQRTALPHGRCEARPEVERFTGARIESRLQRLARSIFSVPPRRAARRTQMVRSSAGRRTRLDGTSSNAPGERVREPSRERTREREGFRSTARSRSDRRKAS
jgi:hypothetical protein